MSSVSVTAAGNDITATSEGYSDSQRLGRFVIYDFVRWLRSVMFHCKNNKTMCQKSPACRAGRSGKEFVIDGLCVSQDAPCSWPLGVSDQSLWLRCLEAELLWWLQIYGDVLLIAPKGAGGPGRENEVFAQFIPRQDPESASLHPKVEGSDLESNESCIYLGLEEEKQFDGYSRKKHQALVGLQSWCM